MAIEGVKSNAMSQMTKVENVTPVEHAEAVPTNVQGFSPVAASQGSDKQSGEQQKKNDKEQQKDIKDVSPEKVKSAISDINKKIRPTHTQCEFKYHEDTKRISITVRDSDTDKVIKEIPPEKTLDMIAKTLELAGILVDEKR